MAAWVDEYKRMIDDCVERESRLSEWEQGFIDSISNWLEAEKPLTPKQLNVLEKVWERATADG